MMIMVAFVQVIADDAHPGRTVVSDVHLESGKKLTLGLDGNISLCPDGPRRCSFAPNSTVEVRLSDADGASGDVVATTTVVIGSGGLHIPHLLIHVGATVVLSSAASSTTASDVPSWTFDSVRLMGGTIEVVGKSAYAASKTLTFASGKRNTSSTTSEKSTVMIASGATFTKTERAFPLHVTGAAVVHLLHASSSLQVGSDLISESGARFLWTLGGKSADPQKMVSQIAGNIYVEGNCVIASGTTAVVQQDRKVPVKATIEIGETVSSLMSAVDFSGNFDSIILGEQVQCARATTSESWSSFSILVSSQCLSQCAAEGMCKTEIVVPSVEGTGNVDGATESQERGKVVLTFVVVIFIAIGAIVLVGTFGRRLCLANRVGVEKLSGIGHPGMMSRRSPYLKTSSEPDGRESDMVSLLVN